jgi:hypothetical protein
MPTVVTSLATVMVTSVFGTMVARVTTTDHKGEALEECKILKPRFDLMFGVRDDVSDLGAAGMSLKNGRASDGEEGIVGRRRHSEEVSRI